MDGVVVTSTASGTAPGRPASDPQAAPAISQGLRPLHPRQVQVWRLGWGGVALAAAAGVLAVELAAALSPAPGLPWPTGTAAALALALGAGLAWHLPRVAFDAWRYQLADSTLELHRGVLVRNHTSIPYFRVQHIDITRTPVERAFGLSRLVVRTAAATTDARIPGIAVSDADLLRDVILARTGRGDAV